MGLMLNFSRLPSQTVLMLLALLLSGIAEGVGLSALLPMLNIALGSEAASMIAGVAPSVTTVLNRRCWTRWPIVGIAPTWATCSVSCCSAWH